MACQDFLQKFENVIEKLHDGNLSVDEYKALLAAEFEGSPCKDEVMSKMECVDKNKDGMIAASEFKKCYREMIAKAVKTNIEKYFEEHGGKLNKEEFEELIDKLVKVPEKREKIKKCGWKRGDKDGDGQITAEEFEEKMDRIVKVYMKFLDA